MSLHYFIEKEIDGVSITFSSWGIIINPKKHDLNSPTVINAFRQAVEMFESVDNQMWEEEDYNFGPREYSPVNDTYPGVYLIEMHRDDLRGLYKIGCTGNLAERSRQNYQHWGDFTLQHFIATRYYHDLEQQLHIEYRAKRKQYEFFSLSPEDVGKIQSITSYTSETN